jgi:type IV pilus assembly protein PilC
MPRYKWTALGADGARINGQSAAADAGALAVQLEQSGLLLVKARAQGGSLRLMRARIRLLDLVNFSFQMTMMLRAGVPLMEALRDMENSEGNPALRQVISALTDGLSSGKTLSQAMAEHPSAFDEVYVSLVRAGESSGQLPEVLAKLTETLKWQHEIAAQTRKALIYPCAALVIITGVTLFLMSYLVPQVASLLKVMRIELPWQTVLMIKVSEVVEAHVGKIVAGLVSLVVLFPTLARIPGPLRGVVDGLKLKLPIVGPVLRQIALARFAYVLALLYAAGITVVEALKVVEIAVGNRAVAQAVAVAHGSIVQGRGLSAAFSGMTMFPPMVVSMLRVGEATGSLDAALENVSYFYTRQARESVENLQASLQPILTVVLGLMLASVIFCTLGPLYDSVITNAKF